jgi:hypothetical protein
MTSAFPNSPKLLRGGLVLVDANSGTVKRVIALQYNPDSLQRSLQVQGTGDTGERSEVLRLKGPAIETIKLEAEIDAADHLEFPDQHANTVQFGIQPQLAALEGLINPTAAELISSNGLASAGTIEIAPAEAPLTLFVWSKQRILPVRLTEFSITEEAFDPSLNPLRAKISLGLRVLSVSDVGFSHKAGTLFLGHLQNQEKLAGKAPGAALSALGLGGIP